MYVTICVSYMQFVTCNYKYKLTGSESHYVEGKDPDSSQCLRSKALFIRQKPGLRSLFHCLAFCSQLMQIRGIRVAALMRLHAGKVS